VKTIGRGNSIIFGKVSLISETETMDKLVIYLEGILKKLGYPEKKADDMSPEMKKIEEELNKELEDGKEVSVSAEEALRRAEGKEEL
jgi:hypothetical protein